MSDTLQPGLSLTRKYDIDAARTIAFMGDECRVYSTPALLYDIEVCCRDLLLQHIGEGKDSVGDAALVHFAATLRRHLRPADTIARLGGDEFALILMNCSGGDACLLLERLQQALAGSPLSVPGGAVPLRFSAGVAELHAAESLGQVLERADAALLDAKQLGKAMVRLNVPPARSARWPSAPTPACC